jgi:hypothetical protein
MILIISLEVDVQVDRGVWRDPRSESGEFWVLETPKEISTLVIWRQVRIVQVLVLLCHIIIVVKLLIQVLSVVCHRSGLYDSGIRSSSAESRRRAKVLFFIIQRYRLT